MKLRLIEEYDSMKDRTLWLIERKRLSWGYVQESYSASLVEALAKWKRTKEGKMGIVRRIVETATVKL